jgi:predicted nucleic-acid-binding protein
MRSVDTNVLVRLITRDDPRQAAIAKAFIAQGAWASLIAITETMWVLDTVYQLSASQLVTALEMLLNNKTLTIQDADAVAGALDFLRANPSLGFADCLRLQLARKAGHLPLGTFDGRLAKLDGAQKL